MVPEVHNDGLQGSKLFFLLGFFTLTTAFSDLQKFADCRDTYKKPSKAQLPLPLTDKAAGCNCQKLSFVMSSLFSILID